MTDKILMKNIRKKCRKQGFGSKFREWREGADCTQIQFAKLLGWTSSQNIANVENGSATLPIDKIKLMCKLVNNLSPEEVVDCILDTERQIYLEIIYNKGV